MSGYIGNIPTPQATQTRDTFTATAGQTTFATSGYTPSFLDVFMNGVKLVSGSDFTATNGSDVVLTSGAAAGDVLEVVAFSTFQLADPTFTGTVTATSFSGDGSALTGISTDLVGDTTPQLGGNLDLNSSDITGTGNINITGSATFTGALTSQGIDDNATSTAMTLDASGNLLVAKTASSLSTTGVQLNAEGSLSAVKAGVTGYFNRLTTDGDIVRFYKDGTTVGSIGAATASGVTSIYAGNDDTALWFRNGIDAVTPFSISGNTTRDAAINIGQSGGRFKDLYLSGSISDGTNSATVAQIVSGGGAGSIVAFVNFNGTNNSIRNSGNVSSITDHGTGQYTINFSSALSTANYSWSYGVSDGGSASNPRTMNPTDTSTKSTTAFRTAWQDQANNTNDPTYACVNFIT